MEVKLFQREGGKIHLTRDGELLYKLAMPLIEQFEHLDEQFTQRRSEVEEGSIQVAAGWSTILYVLPKYVETFRHAHPRIQVHLHNVTGAEGLEQLRAGAVDLALGPMNEAPEDIEFHPIISYEPVVITAIGHPLARQEKVTLTDISRYPLILPPRNLSTWTMVDSTFKKHGLSYEIAMEVGGWEVIKKYVELGLGISIISSIGIGGQERLEVLPAGEYFPKRTYGLVLRKGKRASPQAQLFIELLLKAGESSPALPRTTAVELVEQNDTPVES